MRVFGFCALFQGCIQSSGGEWIKNIMDEEMQYHSEESAVTYDWAKKIVRLAMYAVVFLAPLLFLPQALPVWFGKQTVVYMLVGLAFIGWLVDFLANGSLSYRKSFLNVMFLLLLAVLLLSTLLSGNVTQGLWGVDSTGEKFSSFLVFVLAYFLLAAVSDGKSSVTLSSLLFGSSLLLGLMTLFQMMGYKMFSGVYASTTDFNPIGTANSLAVFYGLISTVGIGVLAHFKDFKEALEHRFGSIFYWLVLAATAVMLLNLFLIVNFKAVWIGLGAAMMVLVSLSVRVSGRDSRGGGIARFGGISFYLPLIVLVLSILLYFSSFQQNFMDSMTGGAESTTRWSLRFPAEVSPSFRATFDIGRQVLSQDLFFGSGPGTFINDYSLYRDKSLNFDRIFWSVKFFHGSALAPTMLATTGLLGIIVFLLALLVAIGTILKNTLTSKSGEPLRFGIAAAVVFGVLMWFLYPPTFTTSLFVFLLIGVFAALAGPDEGGILSFGKRTVAVSSSSMMFIGSLVAIFFIVGSISGVYYSFQKYLAESYFTAGMNIINTTTDFDGAIAEFKNAYSIDPRDDKYLRLQSQVNLVKLRAVINALLSNPTQENLQLFDNTFVQSYEAARQARDLNPFEVSNWSLIGAICETVIPIPPRQRCSEKFLTDTYETAIKYDPISPQVYLDAGRGWLLAADILQVRINQSKDAEEQKKFQQDRVSALNNAITFLTKSADLKPDFASAHFLSAQVRVRQNDLKGAIKKLEDTQSVAPDDVGVLFQLGFLYYQDQDLQKAQLAFERAVQFNTNYSNARYFLGLIYDQQGNKPAALDQFLKIGVLNPDNQEVKLIVDNLSNNRPALASIVPPLPAPDKRQTPPVQDVVQ